MLTLRRGKGRDGRAVADVNVSLAQGTVGSQAQESDNNAMRLQRWMSGVIGRWSNPSSRLSDHISMLLSIFDAVGDSQTQIV